MAKKAFLFAGQGAQVPGMAGELQGNARVDELFALCEDLCPDVLRVMLSGTKEELSLTKNTQPAMYVADLAYALAAEESGVPDAVCGFSVGEVPALAYAGAVSHADGLRMILRRAELMQAACEQHGGAMLAVVGLPPEQVEAIAAASKEAWAVNYNCATQTVVACATDSVDEVTARVAEAKGRAIRLAVSGAFHCPYLREASAAYAQFLRTVEFHAPRMPVYANLTAQPYEGDFADLLARQMMSPVLFARTVQTMRAAGITEFVEVGPGKVLTGLVGKIAAGK